MTLLFNKRLLSLSNLLFRILKKHPTFANLIESVMNLTDMDMSLTHVTYWILMNQQTIRMQYQLLNLINGLKS